MVAFVTCLRAEGNNEIVTAPHIIHTQVFDENTLDVIGSTLL